MLDRMLILLFITVGVLVVAPATAAEEKKNRLPIVDRAIEHHGGGLYEDSETELDVCSRSGCYRVIANVLAGRYSYNVFGPYLNHRRRVVSTSDDLTHTLDGAPQKIAPDEAQSLRDWAMARVYFAFLPYRLNDPNVFKEDLGIEDWEGRKLHKVKVTFAPGSSTDASDEYIYWFDPETARVEQFAYSFEGAPGGLRFRQGSNYRREGGILFFDQSNLGAAGDELSVDQITPEFVRDKMRLISRVSFRNIDVRLFR